MITLKINKELNGSDGVFKLDLDCKLSKGDFITIYGKSGVGKTSILRMIAGLLNPDDGLIKVNNDVWFSAKEKISLKPQKRKVGFLFQEYALFPNMTVKENLEYALSSKKELAIVEELIDIIELNDLQHKKPDVLSGGQKQRVALARALVTKPEILMLDEPLSALDNEMRLKLQNYLLKIHKKYNLTTILVSHDIGEIFRLSNRVLVLENGIISKQGTPSEVFGNKKVNANFQFTGEVVGIAKQDVLYIVSAIIGDELVKVIADESEIINLKIGDKVLITSKPFNPMIKKIN